MPTLARRLLGYELSRVQEGERPHNWKPMPTVGPGVEEIRVHANGAFRLLYIAKFREAVYVLYAFEKKTERTSPLDLAVARVRYRALTRSRQVQGNR
jgi:phage-related protein